MGTCGAKEAPADAHMVVLSSDATNHCTTSSCQGVRARRCRCRTRTHPLKQAQLRCMILPHTHHTTPPAHSGACASCPSATRLGCRPEAQHVARAKGRPSAVQAVRRAAPLVRAAHDKAAVDKGRVASLQPPRGRRDPRPRRRGRPATRHRVEDEGAAVASLVYGLSASKGWRAEDSRGAGEGSHTHLRRWIPRRGDPRPARRSSL